MLKKIRKTLTQKGQGVVEYALILGFVAIIAVYLLTGSGLKDSLKTNINNANAVAEEMDLQYRVANGTTQIIGNVGAESAQNTPGSAPDIPFGP